MIAAKGALAAMALLLVFSAESAQLLRSPYLQVGTPDSIVVLWRTSEATPTYVIFGTNLASLDQTNSSPALSTEHEMRLTGLLPDTRYYYACGSEAEIHAPAGTNQFFFTAPPLGTPNRTRIWVIGDAGLATPGQLAVRDAFYRLNGTNRVDFWLQLGDNGYWNGTDSEYQLAMFDVYSRLLNTSVTWPTLGNHDTGGLTDYTNNYAYFSIFTLPTAGEAGGVPSGTEHYYSFNYANIHFVCLNSMTTSRSPTGEMALWLERDLAAHTNQWLIAFWHHSPYSKGSHDSDTEIELLEMRENLLPILEARGVDLVLSGNSHSYERSFLLDSHYGTSSNLTPAMILNAGYGREGGSGPYLKPHGYGASHYGAVQVVLGCSGEVRGGPLNHPAMCVSSNVLGSMLLEICGNRLDAIFLRETGETNDAFTILKTNFPPITTNLYFTIDADTPAQLALFGSDPDRDPLDYRSLSLPGYGLLSGPDPYTGRFIYTPARGALGPDTFRFQARDSAMTSAPATVTITITPPADINLNGLADAWESWYNIHDPTADADQDGMSNLQEYLADTHPRNPQSALRILSGKANPNLTLTWSSIGGVRYRVSYLDGATNTGYAPIVRPLAAEMDPATPGFHSTMMFTDDFTLTGQPASGIRFYRIEVVR